MTVCPKRAIGSVIGIVLLVSLSACSSEGQATEGVCSATAPGEAEQECIDSGTGEGPMDND